MGEKTAAKLINTYGGLDGIFANVDKQTPKLKASLAEHEARVRHNHELMVLRRDAPIEVDFDRARRVDPTSRRSTGCSTSSSSAACGARLDEALAPIGSSPMAAGRRRRPR